MTEETFTKEEINDKILEVYQRMYAYNKTLSEAALLEVIFNRLFKQFGIPIRTA